MMHNIKYIITWDYSRESGQHSTLVPKIYDLQH